jgi:hypothetical protein
MRESFTYGSVGRAPRKRCLYPELDAKQPAPVKMAFCAWDELI